MAESRAEDDFILEGGGSDDAAHVGQSSRRRRPRLVAAVVALTLTGLAVGGVGAMRALELIPLPPPPVLDPEPDLLDAGGVGDVRLGMSRLDLMTHREAWFDPNGTVDSEHGCTWYEVEGGSDRFSVWAWERDGEVVAVGMGIVIPFNQPDDGRPDRLPRTWTGLTFGAPLEPRPDQLDRWVEEVDAPVPVMRRQHGGMTTTLADTTGDGSLDYATVATAPGEACTRDVDEFLFRAPEGGISPSSAVTGDRFRGLEVGMPLEEARRVAGWQEFGSDVLGGGSGRGSGSDCVQLLNSNGGSAFIDDVVIGFGALGIEGGPEVGMGMHEVARFVDPATREELLGWEQNESSRSWGLWGQISGTDPLGRELTVTVVRDHAMVDGIDVPVTAPALAGPPTVAGVLVGRSC